MTKWKNLELISVRKCPSLSKVEVEEEEYKPVIGVNKRGAREASEAESGRKDDKSQKASDSAFS